MIFSADPLRRLLQRIERQRDQWRRRQPADEAQPQAAVSTGWFLKVLFPDFQCQARENVTVLSKRTLHECLEPIRLGKSETKGISILDPLKRYSRNPAYANYQSVFYATKVMTKILESLQRAQVT